MSWCIQRDEGVYNIQCTTKSMLSALGFFNSIIALNYLSNRLTVCTCIFNVEITIHLQKGFKLAHRRSSFLGCLPFFIAAALPQPVTLILFLKIFLQVLTLLSRVHYQLARNGLIPLPKSLLEGKPTCCMP